jgi:hypothetical protein
VRRAGDIFDAVPALHDAVVEHGLEGHREAAGRRLPPGYRGWTKIKNLGYWRRASEVPHMECSRERRANMTCA